MRALPSTLNFFKDAKFDQRDIFALYRDCSNAFKDRDQDEVRGAARCPRPALYRKAAIAVYRKAAIDTTEDLNAGASTCVRTPGGITASTCVGRGVLQGD